MNVTAVILSAGVGRRMGGKIPKQYMDVDGKPLLYYTIKAFEDSRVDGIIIVTGASDIEYVKREIVDNYSLKKVERIIAGGKERYNSSYNGLKAAQNADYVLLHDGARPCISSGKINDIIENVLIFGACIPGVPVKDTIKISDDKMNVLQTPPRKAMWQIQTPQAFKREMIISAYEKMLRDDEVCITDDSMIIEKYSDSPVKIVMGEYSNIKVTTPEDICTVEQIIKAK